MIDQESSATDSRGALIESLFRQLSGSWILDRRLSSTNTLEPAGNCHGTATLSPREPSVFINNDGKLELASAEMVYHEQGYFEMQQTTTSTTADQFPFSRKYIWRLTRKDGDIPSVSVWFAKPGTEVIDYLFHKINLTVQETEDGGTTCASRVDGNAGHLCIEDLYSSTYTFDFCPEVEGAAAIMEQLTLRDWTMLHEVQGPKKDQVIETRFTRV